MDAMHCLRMPHGPAGGPDRPVLSHSSQRNRLLRHLAFPKGGARVTAARQWTVCAQVPPPSLQEREDPNPKGRLGGWHRTRGAAVGAAVVLACALGSACLSRGRGAYYFAQAQPTAQTQDVGSLPPAGKTQKSLDVAWGAAPKERLKLLLDVVDQIRGNVGPRDLEPGKTLLLGALAEQLNTELVKDDYRCLKAFRREQRATYLLCEEWLRLKDYDGKKDPGLLLVEILINQRDYQKALTICEHEHIKGAGTVPRRHLFLAIIKMMQAVESMLEPKKSSDKKELDDKLNELKKLMDAAKCELETFQAFAQPPNIQST